MKIKHNRDILQNIINSAKDNNARGLVVIGEIIQACDCQILTPVEENQAITMLLSMLGMAVLA